MIRRRRDVAGIRNYPRRAAQVFSDIARLVNVATQNNSQDMGVTMERLLAALFGLVVSVSLMGCMGEEVGPSDAMVEADMADQIVSTSDGYMTVKIVESKREVVAKDLVKFHMRISPVRTEKQPPKDVLAKALAMKQLYGDEFYDILMLPPGPVGEPGSDTIEYVLGANGWQMREKS